jgi:hypothetical protein
VALKQQVQKLQKLDVQLQASPDKQRSLADPDARSMMLTVMAPMVAGRNCRPVHGEFVV